MTKLPNALPADPAVLADYLSAMEVARAYTFHIDQRDWSAYADLFGETVKVDYEPRKPGIPTDRIPSKEWAKGAKKSLGKLKATHHTMSPYAVRFEGEGATVTSYCSARHYEPSVEGDPTFTEHSVYELALVRNGDGWLIDTVHARVLWTEGNRSVLFHELED